MKGDDTLGLENFSEEKVIPKAALEPENLKKMICEALSQQGFDVNGDRIVLHSTSKEFLRRVHEHAVRAEVGRAKSSLSRHETRLLSYIANGNEVDPNRVRPVIVRVLPDTEYARLFRYASLHWSIPISNGYGRRMRFLVLDEYNGKLIGLLGLCDPVFSLRARDEWIGWGFEQRRQRLVHVMEAYVLGAVPPYSQLLFGKFIAMVAASIEIREAFRKQYTGRETVIRQRYCPADLALVTTTSALGRSSVYNRLRYRDRLIMQSVGYTTGWGTFHFANGLYEKILDFAHANCVGTAKAQGWGGGEFRNRLEVVRKCLKTLGLPTEWIRHQVRREIFVAPLASNAREFLRGMTDTLDYYDEGIDAYFEFFRERWLIPRAQRDGSYRSFRREEWRLW